MAAYNEYNFPEANAAHNKHRSQRISGALHTIIPQEKEASCVTNEELYSNLPQAVCPISERRHLNGRKRDIPVSIVITIVVLVILLIGTAIAGGVGSTLAVKTCNNELSALRLSSASATSPALLPLSSSSSTTSPPPSSSSSTTSPAASTPIPVTGCHGDPSFSTTYTSIKGYTFNKTCFHAIGGYDIVGTVVSSWELCMEACANYNFYKNSTDGPTCVAVTFVPSWIIQEWAVGNASIWTNCGLKYYAPPLATLPDLRSTEMVVSIMKT